MTFSVVAITYYYLYVLFIIYVYDNTASLFLTDDQKEFQNVALNFANTELKPFAEKWDAEKFFPVDTLRRVFFVFFKNINSLFYIFQRT